MAKTVKLIDIAEKVGVSVVTVSKALSDKSGVSEEMRARIKALANELGYVSPSAAHLTGEKDSFNIGVLVAKRYFNQSDSFYWKMYQEVATKAVSKGSFTMLEILEPSSEENLVLPKLLRDNRADGLVIIGTTSPEYLRMLRSNITIPYMCLDFYDKSEDSDSVITDNFYGMYKLVNYLFKEGHEKIAYVGTLLSTDSITDRYMGYCKSMLEHGKQVPPDYVIDDRSHNLESIDFDNFTCTLPKDMPTAFACNCDITASLLIRFLRERGIRVPEDVSVVGFDNYLSHGNSGTEITTYEVDIKEMARETINNLLKKLRGENSKHGITVVEGRIIIKNSVKRI